MAAPTRTSRHDRLGAGRGERDETYLEHWAEELGVSTLLATARDLADDSA